MAMPPHYSAIGVLQQAKLKHALSVTVSRAITMAKEERRKKPRTPSTSKWITWDHVFKHIPHKETWGDIFRLDGKPDDHFSPRIVQRFQGR